MAVNKAIRDQEEQEAYRELRALLKLLTQLTQRDVSERGRGSGVDVAQVSARALMLHAYSTASFAVPLPFLFPFSSLPSCPGLLNVQNCWPP